VTDFAKGNYDELEPFEMGSFQGVFARSALGSEQVGVSRFRYAPNHASAAGHRHAVQEEVYVVVSGSGRMRLDDEVVDVRPWDVIRVAPAVVRGFRAGPDGLEVIVAGGTRPPDGDGELVPDWWTEP
jgi:uncharacterized cupin superfamily protein